MTGYAPLKNIFETTPFCHAFNKILRNFGRIQFIAKSSSIYKNLFAPQSTVGGKSPLQLSSRTHFAKMKIKKLLLNKKLIAGVCF